MIITSGSALDLGPRCGPSQANRALCLKRNREKVKKERYLVPAYGPDVNALQIAMQALEIVGAKLNSEAAIVVPALKYAKDTILNKVIPEKQLKTLIKGGSLAIGDSAVPLSLVSKKTIHNTSAGVMLGVFASKDMIEKIESSIYCKAIIVLPWAGDEDIKEWKDKWSPVTLELNEKI